MGITPVNKKDLKVIFLENIHVEAAILFEKEGLMNIDMLSSSLNGKELIDIIKDAHILGIRSGTNLDKEVLSHCSNLMAIGCFCIGTNQVDLVQATHQGIPVFNDPHSNTRSVAELVIGLCVVLMRDLFNKNAAALAGKWVKTASGCHELREKKLGIVGYGRIGSQVSILAEAIGMKVCYYDIEKKLSIGNVKVMASLEELLEISDIVSLHIPATPQTLNLINREHLQRMKKTAFLINTSRGNVVDSDALFQSLYDKEIAGAALDVFQNEPLGGTKVFESPFQKLTNVILTPHIGGSTEEAQENIVKNVSHKLLNFISIGSSEGSANFPWLNLPPFENSNRILHIHKNVPGVLSKLNNILAKNEINIFSQYLKTNSEVGYVVFDIKKDHHLELINELKAIKGTIRARILY